MVLADLGESRNADHGVMTRGVGTPLWMAPEVIRGHGRRAAYTVKADIYSLGLVFWEILTRRIPFGDVEDFSLERVDVEGLRPTLPQSADPLLASLITDCWQGDPDMRPTADDVVRRLEELIARRAASVNRIV